MRKGAPLDAIDFAAHADVARRRVLAEPWRASLSAKIDAMDAHGDFNRLVAEAGLLTESGELAFKPLEHQIAAARDVLRDKRGRALLADDVGLGKTIEALIILREYELRGLVKRTLVLAPGTLVDQWRREVEDKLGKPAEQIYTVEFGTKRDEIRAAIARARVVIANINSLKNSERSELLEDSKFDLVIVDEVHSILSTSQERRDKPGTPLRGYKLVESIEKKFILLLSATPIRNTVVDLWELVNLTRPGQLMTWPRFKSDFISGFETRADGSKLPIIKSGEKLQKLLREVIVRRVREEVMTAGSFPERRAMRLNVTLREDERTLYRAVQQKLVELRKGTKKGGQELEIADALGSHPEAFIEKVGSASEWRDLITHARRLGMPTKLQTLIKFVHEAVAEKTKKVLIFARFPRAREQILEALATRHVRVSAFPRKATVRERIRLLREFEREKDVLVVDDSAAVGLNLQFCDHLINYDFPSDPFLVEQRIGRIQRIGQRSRWVHIINFYVEGTIDAIKLDLCEGKLAMFAGVFGRAPEILGAIEEELDLDAVLKELLLEANVDRLEKRWREVEDTFRVAEHSLKNAKNGTADFFKKLSWVT